MIIKEKIVVEREREPHKQLVWKMFQETEENGAFCTFSLFQLVLHLLVYNICWFYP